jgi:chemotaxis family two-component system sensor kinase Cph1
VNLPLMAPEIPVDLSNCDLEPIHIPSLIQAHGMFLAARNSDLRVVYVSANSLAIFGVAPATILERTLTDILGAEAVTVIQQALGQESYLPRDIRFFTFPLSGERRFDVTVHRTHGLLCVELEVALEPRRDLLATHLETAMRALGGKTLSELYSAIPPLVRELTGYDRVMVYKFDADGHGEVVGEAKADEMEPFLGLHYPATDIPQQARKLYLQQRFRTIVDVNYIPVPLLANRALIHNEPLDMTFCSLRSTSPIHIEYLQNMGVGASLAISVISSGELWGMIVGHHRTSKHLSPELRTLSDLLGQFISLLIGVARQVDAAADYREKKSLIDRLSAPMEKDLLTDNGLATSAQMLLDLVHSDGAIVRLGGHLALLGSTPALGESTALLDAFQSRIDGDTLSTNMIGDLFPAFAHLASEASGGLLVSFQEPLDGILWLRGEIAETVRWAGKPDASKQYFEGSFSPQPPQIIRPVATGAARAFFTMASRRNRGRPGSPAHRRSCSSLAQRGKPDQASTYRPSHRPGQPTRTSGAKSQVADKKQASARGSTLPGSGWIQSHQRPLWTSCWRSVPATGRSASRFSLQRQTPGRTTRRR